MKAFHSPFSRCTLKTVSKDHALGQGVRNKFAQFNGTGDYAVVDLFSFPSSEGTVVVRCRATSGATIGNRAGLLDMSPGAGVSYYPFNDGNAYQASFRINRVDGIALSGSVDRTEWHWVIIRTNAGSGWQMLQGTDAGTLYSVATAAHEAFTSSQQQIGTSNGISFWGGDIDRFLLFASRLADAEIQAIIAGGNGTSPLVRYEFSSNAGGIFADASGNGRNATITGSPTIVSV